MKQLIFILFLLIVIFSIRLSSAEDINYTIICNKIFYFLAEKNMTYTDLELFNFKKSLYDTYTINFQDTQDKINNYTLFCEPLTNLKLPTRDFGTLKFSSNYLAQCQFNIGRSVIGFDMDSSIPFFTLYLTADSCDSIDFFKYFFDLKPGIENQYSIVGIKLWFPLLLLLSLLIVSFIKSNSLLNKALKGVKR